MSFGVRECEFCGAPMELKIRRDLGRKHFCSRSCRQLGRYARGEWGEDRMKAMQSIANAPDMWTRKSCPKEKNGRWLSDRSTVKFQRSISDLHRWRKAVFERDNYTCQACGQIGGALNAHHVKSYKNHPELRESVSNGLTLCVECHKKTDNYGGRVHAILL